MCHAPRSRDSSVSTHDSYMTLPLPGSVRLLRLPTNSSPPDRLTSRLERSHSPDFRLKTRLPILLLLIRISFPLQSYLESTSSHPSPYTILHLHFPSRQKSIIHSPHSFYFRAPASTIGYSSLFPFSIRPVHLSWFAIYPISPMTFRVSSSANPFFLHESLLLNAPLLFPASGNV